MIQTGIGSLPLTATTIQALTDGQFFLEHIAVLRRAAIEPFCKVCHALGLNATISAITRPDEFTFRCEHTSGFVKRDQFLDLQPLLGALRWDLRCTKCGQLIEADNGKTDAVFVVSCPCTMRTMPNPMAQASSLSRVDGLGSQQSV